MILQVYQKFCLFQGDVLLSIPWDSSPFVGAYFVFFSKHQRSKATIYKSKKINCSSKLIQQTQFVKKWVFVECIFFWFFGLLFVYLWIVFVTIFCLLQDGYTLKHGFYLQNHTLMLRTLHVSRMDATVN